MYSVIGVSGFEYQLVCVTRILPQFLGEISVDSATDHPDIREFVNTASQPVTKGVCNDFRRSFSGVVTTSFVQIHFWSLNPSDGPRVPSGDAREESL